MKLQNKVCIITGASGGFGIALSRRLLAAGCKLVLADIDLSRARAPLTSYSEKRNVIFVPCNVSVKSDLDAVFAAAKQTFGRIDVVYNNAGIPETTFFYTDLDDAWRDVIDIDLTCVIQGTRLALTAFAAQGSAGVVVNISSLAGLYPQGLQPIYSAAKAGVISFSRSCAKACQMLPELKGCRVVAVAPSFSPTGIVEKSLHIYPEPLRDALVRGVAKQMVPVDLCIDAFVRAVEDDSLVDSVLRITPEYGIDVIGISGDGKSKDGKGGVAKSKL
jgi:NAD(P)-dependent dehydrogenase (short-subunit alcohol dehydrogenase family)